jgi:hypothetical protein
MKYPFRDLSQIKSHQSPGAECGLKLVPELAEVGIPAVKKGVMAKQNDSI